jgi:hypothetical protein
VSELCATCELATSADWDDFKELALREYANFRNQGGDAFIALWIPHVNEDENGHLVANCAGDYCLMIGPDGEKIVATLMGPEGDVGYWRLPWVDTNLLKLTELESQFVLDPWLEPGEAQAFLLGVDVAVQRLKEVGETPLDAWFTVPEWVLEFEENGP